MAYHITKQSRMAGIGTMYYADNNRWTDVYENRKVYPTLFQQNKIRTRPIQINGVIL